MSRTDEGWIVTLSQEGQATIPRELREKHGIKPGRKVRIRENEKGEIVVDPSLVSRTSVEPQPRRCPERSSFAKDGQATRNGVNALSEKPNGLRVVDAEPLIAYYWNAPESDAVEPIKT